MQVTIKTPTTEITLTKDVAQPPEPTPWSRLGMSEQEYVELLAKG